MSCCRSKLRIIIQEFKEFAGTLPKLRFQPSALSMMVTDQISTTNQAMLHHHELTSSTAFPSMIQENNIIISISAPMPIM